MVCKQCHRYAVVAAIIYPIGILAVYISLIYVNHETLRGGFGIPPHLTFLVASYDVECYWFEPLDLVRKPEASTQSYTLV